jgi:hypothetical protein
VRESERERERERERESYRQTDRQTDREKDQRAQTAIVQAYPGNHECSSLLAPTSTRFDAL